MNKLKQFAFKLLCFLPFLSPVAPVVADDNNEGNFLSSAQKPAWSKSRIALGLEYGSNAQGYLDVMVPVLGDNDFMIYGTVSGYYGSSTLDNTHHQWQVNAGAGMRRVNDAETAITGLYAFVGQLNSPYNNTFRQALLGYERLGTTWDIHANIAVPFGETKQETILYNGGTIFFQGHNIISRAETVTESLSPGAFFEVGRRIGSSQLRGYAGAYYYGETQAGGVARIQYQWTNNLSVSARVQYDNNNQFQYLAGVEFSIGGAHTVDKNSIYNRMTERVLSTPLISQSTQVLNQSLESNNKVWVVNQQTGTSNGDGTFDQPFASLQQALANAPENTDILIIGSQSPLVVDSSAVKLKQGQHIFGTQKDLYYDFSLGRFTQVKDVDVIKALSGNGIVPVIPTGVEMNYNSGLHYVTIQSNDGTSAATHDSGVVINNLNDGKLNNKGITLEGLSIIGFKNYGVSVTNSQDVQLVNTVLSDNNIGLLNQNQKIVGITNITANNLTITNSKNVGLQSDGGNSTYNNLAISSDVNGALAALEMYSGSVTINGIDFSGSETYGILANSGGAAPSESGFLTLRGGDSTDFQQISGHDTGINLVRSSGTTFNATGITVDNNTTGISVESNVAHLTDVTLMNNDVGIVFNVANDNTSSSILTNMTVKDNTTTGVQIIEGTVRVIGGTYESGKSGSAISGGITSANNKLRRLYISDATITAGNPLTPIQFFSSYVGPIEATSELIISGSNITNMQGSALYAVANLVTFNIDPDTQQPLSSQTTITGGDSGYALLLKKLGTDNNDIYNVRNVTIVGYNKTSKTNPNPNIGEATNPNSGKPIACSAIDQFISGHPGTSFVGC